MSVISKTCVVCSQPAKLLCSRCADSYCSTACQKADWQMHRQICFKMPHLVPDLVALEESFSAKLVLSSEKALISASLDVPSLVDTRATKGTKDEITEKPTKKQNEVRPLKPLQVPSYGDNDKQKKELPHQPTLNVNQAAVEKEQQKPPTQDLDLTQKSNDRVTQMKMPEEFDQPKPPTQSEIKAVAQNLRTPTKLTTNEIIKPAEPLKRFMFSELKQRSWPTTKNIKVGMFDWMEPNQINVFEDNETVRAWQEHIQKEVNNYCGNKTLSKYKPIKDEIILALFEGEWYRAHVLDTDVEEPIVQYIDYGNLAQMKPYEMMMIPREIAEMEVCIRYYVVDNMPEALKMNEKQIEIMESASFYITNIREERGVHLCNILGF